jgi:hypothetical protein
MQKKILAPDQRFGEGTSCTRTDVQDVLTLARSDTLPALRSGPGYRIVAVLDRGTCHRCTSRGGVRDSGAFD